MFLHVKADRGVSPQTSGRRLVPCSFGLLGRGLAAIAVTSAVMLACSGCSSSPRSEDTKLANIRSNVLMKTVPPNSSKRTIVYQYAGGTLQGRSNGPAVRETFRSVETEAEISAFYTALTRQAGWRKSTNNADSVKHAWTNGHALMWLQFRPDGVSQGRHIVIVNYYVAPIEGEPIGGSAHH